MGLGTFQQACLEQADQDAGQFAGGYFNAFALEVKNNITDGARAVKETALD